MLKRTFAALAVVGAVALHAESAIAEQAFRWAGYYVGGQIGVARTRDVLTESTAFVPPFTGNATTSSNIFVGGGHAGYSWQVGNIVFGPEIEIEATSLHKTQMCLVQDSGVGNAAPGSCFPNAAGYTFRTEIPWQGAILGRLGYARGSVLLYATGGVAFADIKTTYAQQAPVASSQSFDQERAGYTVGAGLEYGFAAHWTGRLEYRYTDFGTVSSTATSAGPFWNGYTNRHAITTKYCPRWAKLSVLNWFS
jgi:outer membrane immunogenic protein